MDNMNSLHENQPISLEDANQQTKEIRKDIIGVLLTIPGVAFVAVLAIFILLGLAYLLGNLLGALFGSFPQTSFSQGAVPITITLVSISSVLQAAIAMTRLIVSIRKKTKERSYRRRYP